MYSILVVIHNRVIIVRVHTGYNTINVGKSDVVQQAVLFRSFMLNNFNFFEFVHHLTFFTLVDKGDIFILIKSMSTSGNML